MARYRLLERGVFDTVNNWEVLPGSPAWDEYLAWWQSGNVPDPLNTPAPTQSEIDAEVEQQERELIRKQLTADNLVAQLKNRTPAQAEAWIDNNVNNLSDAKAVLKIMAKVLAFLARKYL